MRGAHDEVLAPVQGPRTLRTVRNKLPGDRMHAPDGFLNLTTAAATGAISTGTVAVALRQSREQLADLGVPVTADGLRRQPAA